MQNIRKQFLRIRKIVSSRIFAMAVLSICTAAVLLVVTTTMNMVYINDGDDIKIMVTMKDQPGEILDKAGITTQSNDEVIFTGFNGRLGEIFINRAFPVYVNVGEKIIELSMTGGTVLAALNKAGVTLDENDLINLPLNEDVYENTKILVNLVDYQIYQEEKAIAFPVSEKLTPLLKQGQKTVLVSGSNGKVVSTFRNKLVDGKVGETIKIEEKTVKNPSTQTALVGAPRGTPVSPISGPAGVTIGANGVPSRYSKVINGSATAYSARNGAGTASGRRAAVGHVAVNPAVIPYGSLLYIASPDGSFVYGYAIAADTGAALRNGHCVVDLFFGSYLESCLFGRKAMNVYVVG